MPVPVLLPVPVEDGDAVALGEALPCAARLAEEPPADFAEDGAEPGAADDADEDPEQPAITATPATRSGTASSVFFTRSPNRILG